MIVRVVTRITILIHLLLSGCQLIPTTKSDLVAQQVRPLLNLADVHIDRGDLTEALPLVIQAQTIAPKSESVLLKRAQILALQGDSDHARAIFQKLDQDSPKVSLAYARFLNQVGDVDQAFVMIAVACDAIDFPNRFDALRFRATLAIQRNDLEQAANDLKKLSRMRSSDSEIRLMQIQVALKRGEIQSALAMYGALTDFERTMTEADAIRGELERLANQLQIVGRDFGTYDF